MYLLFTNFYGALANALGYADRDPGSAVADRSDTFTMRVLLYGRPGPESTRLFHTHARSGLACRFLGPSETSRLGWGTTFSSAFLNDI